MDRAEFRTHLKRWRRSWARQDRAESTIDQYVREVERYWEWCDAEGATIASLDSADDYVEWAISERGVHSGRIVCRSIKAFGKHLAEDLDEPDPFKRLRLPKEPEPEKAPTATEDDLGALLATCERDIRIEKTNRRPSPVPERDRAVLLLLAQTGMRRAEVASLRWDDVDLAEARATLRDTKNGETRSVHLPDDVVRAILQYQSALRRLEASYRPPNGSLWVSGMWRTKPFTPDGISQMLRRRGKRAGVDVGAHAFRRMFAGEWMRRGGSETGLMTTAGWKGSAMIARYTRETKEDNAASEAERLFG